MPRCSHDDVVAIFATSLNIEPFILAASAILDHHLMNAGLPAALLKEMERHLSAHLACAADPRYTDLSDSDTRISVQRAAGTGAGLAATDYGRNVLALDPTGILAGVGSVVKRASIRVD